MFALPPAGPELERRQSGTRSVVHSMVMCRRFLKLHVVAAAVAISLAPNAATQRTGSQAGELRVLTTRSIATVLEKIGGELELRTGRKLDVVTDIAIRLVRRVNAGEPFDVLVASPAQIDELIKTGKIIPETRADLARSGIGVAVRAGAPTPDVSSVDAFKRALLAARSIAYLKEGQSGVYIAGVLDRLGILDAVRSKLTLPETDVVSQLVSQGEIELGIVVITQIVTTSGVALAGPLPAEIQSHITFTAGISAHSGSPDAAKELLAALKGPLAVRVMKSQAMEPGTIAPPEELAVLSAVGMRQVMLALAPTFEQETGHKLAVTFDGGAVIVRRVQGGEDADLVIVPRPLIDDLVGSRRADAASVTDVASSTVGLAVRKGAPKPDISSPDAVKRTLLAAKSIAVPDPSLGGASGVHIAQVLDRLGIREELRSRTILASNPDREQEMPGSFVASGRAEIALHQIQELMAVPGVEIVGPLPGDLRGAFLFSASILSRSKREQAGNQLLELLKRPDTRALIASKGMEPAAR
jgi:molybdate transport system substrate-binding protein